MFFFSFFFLLLVKKLHLVNKNGNSTWPPPPYSFSNMYFKSYLLHMKPCHMPQTPRYYFFSRRHSMISGWKCKWKKYTRKYTSRVVMLIAGLGNYAVGWTHGNGPLMGKKRLSYVYYDMHVLLMGTVRCYNTALVNSMWHDVMMPQSSHPNRPLTYLLHYYHSLCIWVISPDKILVDPTVYITKT